jgi:hypothetical protein
MFNQTQFRKGENYYVNKAANTTLPTWWSSTNSSTSSANLSVNPSANPSALGSGVIQTNVTL